MSYNHGNQLVSIARDGWMQEQIYYDGFGRLAMRVFPPGSDASSPSGANEAWRYYLGEEMTIIKHNDGTSDAVFHAPVGSQRVADFWGTKNPVPNCGGGGTTCQNGVTYFQKDLLGSTIAVSNRAGSSPLYPRVHWRYFPYGEVDVQVGSETVDARSERGYAGALKLSEGFLYMRARVYDPHSRRFLQADTVDPRRYTYVGGDPVNRVDPSGHDEVAATNPFGTPEWQAFFNGAGGGPTGTGGGGGAWAASTEYTSAAGDVGGGNGGIGRGPWIWVRPPDGSETMTVGPASPAQMQECVAKYGAAACVGLTWVTISSPPGTWVLMPGSGGLLSPYSGPLPADLQNAASNVYPGLPVQLVKLVVGPMNIFHPLSTPPAGAYSPSMPSTIFVNWNVANTDQFVTTVGHEMRHWYQDVSGMPFDWEPDDEWTAQYGARERDAYKEEGQFLSTWRLMLGPGNSPSASDLFGLGL
jgi:RHS repeat-associated protein